MSESGLLLRLGVLTVAVEVGLGALLGGAPVASGVFAGALGGVAIQWAASVLTLRTRGAENEVFLRSFGRAAMLRVLGGTAYVIALLASGWFLPLAFLAGFGGPYLVLEVVADVLLIRNAKNLDRVG